MSTESDYLLNRKRQANSLSNKFKLMRLFPIKQKKIVFSAFEGDGGFCCNPRYIAEELHRRSSDCEIVWLTKEVDKEFPEYIRVVKYTPWNLAYHLSTAHIWIDNYRKPYGTLKRKGQLYLQTWHASIGFKAVGLYRGDAFPAIAKIVSEWDSNMIDYMISNSDYCDSVYPKKILYDGPTLRTGSPRVDCMINDKEELRKLLRDRIGVGEDVGLLLFAPTFRGGNQKEQKQVIADTPNIDFDQLIKKLEKKTGKQWKVLLRLHPQLSAKLDKMPIKERDNRLIDVSKWPDISLVMGGCDLVITDYSSCAFDAAFAHIAVLLFADDVKEYVANRGQFMWKREELPFLISETNEELINNIELFSMRKYVEQVDLFMKRNGVEEDGKASERVVDWILDRIWK